jgi:hypothetical protein
MRLIILRYKRDIFYLTTLLLLGTICFAMFLSRNSRLPITQDVPASLRPEVTKNSQPQSLIPIAPEATQPSSTISNDLSVLNRYIGEKGFPIIFKIDQNEYDIVYSNIVNGDIVTTEVPLKYCPWTGQRLPPSKRDRSFGTVSPEDAKRIQSKVNGLGTLDQVRQAFGNPDVKSGAFQGVKERWTYTNILTTADVTFSELEDGSLQVMWYGKRIQ